MARERGTGRNLARTGLIVLVALFGWGPDIARAQSFCATCEVMIGSGGTYHFWGTTGGQVVPVTVDWSDNRYEFGFFRVTTEQTLSYRDRYTRVMAQPYGGVSLSRRWQLLEVGPIKSFAGFGLAIKSESDVLSITRWDFASQLGVRFPLPGDAVIGELTVRHWSNAGIRLPNHGQDFATLTVRVNAGLLGIPRTDQIAIDPRLLRESSRLEDSYEPEDVLLP